MHTFYVRHYVTTWEGVATWMPSSLVRVTRNRLGREVSQYVGSGKPAALRPNEVRMNVDWMHFLRSNNKYPER